MSTTVDERVVEMRFDNKQFESNVATTMSTLDKFKQRLNLTGAARGLEDVGTAAKGINLSGLGTAAEAVTAKFSYMQMSIQHQLNRIVDGAVNAGKRVVSAFTIDPIKSGFSEYETKMGSVQTILANTEHQGTKLNDVTAALEELNAYADKTIYNFQEMTRNIGTFTAAGVDLDTSVSSIQGIANLAAVSGSTSQQASTAMYQLSQALSSGTVKLQDWNSVVNAGMGGKVFQNALIRTAAMLDGASKDVETWQKNNIDKYGSFRESLSQGAWLTTDVLTKTLEQFTMAAEEGSDEWNAFKNSLVESGYTEKQAEEILKMANTATDAATKVKTFTQLMDTLKESAQSGWAQTWEMIVGDFEEAKSFFTELSDLFGGIIGESADRRNSLISDTMGSNWEKLVKNINEAGVETTKFEDRIRKVVGNKEMDALIEEWGSVEKAVREGAISSDDLQKAFDSLTVPPDFLDDLKEIDHTLKQGAGGDDVVALQSALDELGFDLDVDGKFGKTTTEAVKEFQKANGLKITGIVDSKTLKALEEASEKTSKLKGNVDELKTSCGELIGDITKTSGRELLLDSLMNVIKAIQKPLEAVGEAWRDVFSVDSTQLYTALEKINKFTKSLTMEGVLDATNWDDLLEKVNLLGIDTDTFKKKLKDTLKQKGLFDDFAKKYGSLQEAFEDGFISMDVIEETLLGFDGISESLLKAGETGEKIRRTFKGLFSIVEIGWNFVKQLARGISELVGHFTGLGGGILDSTAALGDWLSNLSKTVKETDIFGVAVDKVVDFLGGIIDRLKTFGKSVKEAFKSDQVQGFLGFMQGLWNVVKQIGTRIGEIFTPLFDSIVNVFTNSNFDSLLNSGLLGGILAAIIGFGDKLTGPLDGIKDIFESVAGEGGVLDNVKGILDDVRGCFEAYQNNLKADILKKIAVSIAILAGAIFVIGSIDANALDRSLGAITILFVELIGSLKAFSMLTTKLDGVTKAVGLMIGMSVAIAILGVAMKTISSLSWEGIAKGLVAVGALMTELFAFLQFAKFDKKMAGSAKGILILSVAMLVLAKAVEDFGAMQWEEIGKGLAAIGGLLTELALFTKLTGNAGHVIATGVAMVLLGASMKIFASAMKDFATMQWEEIGRGLSAMGGALVEMVLALNLAKGTFGGAASLLVAAAALAIIVPIMKSLGELSWGTIGKGLAAMGGALLELAIALNLMNGTLAGSAALIIAAAALAILTPVMLALGSMSWESIAKGLVAIAGAFAVIGLAGLLLSPIIPAILGLAGAFALFGIATLGLGVGLGLIGAGITAVATALAAGATAIVAGLAAIIGGIVDLIPTILLGLGDAILAICTVIKECAPALVETLFVLLTEVCASIATYVPMIGNALFDLLIGAINVLAERMPELIMAVVNLIGSFFKGIVDALKGIDTSSLIEGLIGVGLLAALMLALSAVASLIPGAMVGVLGMGLVIAELALVLAAIGALAQIPGLSWLIEEGGDFLQTIGTAIGQFVGGIVAGVAEGATSTLPQVGTNLSDFMTNLQPFIDGASTLDASMMDGVKALADCILVLTGAGILDAITSWISGGSSLSQFATDLVPFGTAMKQFATEVSGINAESFTTAVNAAKTLVEVAQSIPSDGLFGTDGIDDFGKNVVTFGKKLRQYGEEVSGIDLVAMTGSVIAARMLVQIANSIPDDGTFGGDGIDNFGRDIASFATSLKKYGDTAAEIDTGAISGSVSAFKRIKEAISGLAGLDTSGIESFKTAINSLGNINVDGFVSAFNAASSSLNSAGANMINSVIAGINSRKSAISSAAQGVTSTLRTAFTAQAQGFMSIGSTLMIMLANGVSSQIKSATNTIISFTSYATSAFRARYSSFYSAGSYCGQGFANGISYNTFRVTAAGKELAAAALKAAKKELGIESPSREFMQVGEYAGEGLVIGLDSYGSDVYKAGFGMGELANSGITKAIRNISETVTDNIDANPTIRPVMDLSDVRSGVRTLNGMIGSGSTIGAVGTISTMMSRRGQNGVESEVVSAINKLRKDLGNVGNTTYSINGITYDNGSEIAGAMQTIVRAARQERRV